MKFSKTEQWWLDHWKTHNMVDRLSHPPIQPYNKRDFNAIQRLAQKGIVTITAIGEGGVAYFKINKEEFEKAFVPQKPGKPGKKLGNYYTYAEAKAKVQELGISGFTAYRQYCQGEDRDPMMPSDPLRTYGSEFEGWPIFCGKTKFLGTSVEKYETYDEASDAAQKLGIQSKEEYERRHHEDPRLPAVPSRFYLDWPEDKPWFKFLGRLVPYSTLTQASEAARNLNIKTKREYDQKFSKDPRLPRCPDVVYENWFGWNWFLGK